MKFSTFLPILASAVANAHYTFPALVVGSTTTSKWQYVRQAANYQSNGFVGDVSSSLIRCNEYSGRGATATYTVAAGSTVGFTADPNIYHPGPLQFYMAKVPTGQTAASWDGSGNVWFKVYSDGPTVSSSGLTWPNYGKTTVTFTIPKALPSGDYLLRVEHIGLHSASSAGGAQFYISCAQLTVTGGGTGTPDPTVSFPGAYTATDPGLLINIYYPVPTNYKAPGPAVWTG